MNGYSISDVPQSVGEDRSTKQNKNFDRKLEQELGRLERQQQIWLKEQSFEARKLVKMNIRRKKSSSSEPPRSPTTLRQVSMKETASISSRERNKTIC